MAQVTYGEIVRSDWLGRSDCQMRLIKKFIKCHLGTACEWRYKR